MIMKDMSNLLSTIFPYISWPNSWRYLVILVGKYKHEVRVVQVIWKKPWTNILKLNTAGSAIDNPRKIGGGDILRDYQRRMIYAFATPLGIFSINQAEIQAAVIGIH